MERGTRTRDLRAAPDFTLIPCCHIHLNHTQTRRVRKAVTPTCMREYTQLSLELLAGVPGFFFCLHSDLPCDLPNSDHNNRLTGMAVTVVLFGYRESLTGGLKRVSLEFPKDRTRVIQASLLLGPFFFLTLTMCVAFSCVFLACSQIRKSQAEVPVPTHCLASQPFRQRC